MSIARGQEGSHDAGALLEIDALTAGYGRAVVLQGFELRLGAGESACLVGANGAGKSTVLNAIYGFADVMSGCIRVGGEDVTRVAPDRKLERAGVGYVLQGSSIFPDLSVEDNLRLGLYGKRRSPSVRAEIERVLGRHPQLEARRRQPARVLSGGERRVLEIARALLMKPRLLLLDEPTLGLEPRAIETIFATLEELKHGGMSLLLVEQNVTRGLAFADTGYVLAAGRVALHAPARDLAADPAVGRLFLGGD